MAPDVATLLLGSTGACAAFTCIKACKQTYLCWHRSGKVNAYIVMVWLEWTSCLSVSLMSWMFLEKRTPPW
ncbi:hypothetical protein CONLIGDRAFT_629395 [Coniochaeta ligniaria NRRL 30616]|uniref:Uncharacterized protein n=1 Tax=Coniochaeta ligniaria NRRL 30616 TaxID=1408157 RepID=A0A1J7IVI6_9PEZI|nr:hypothetical protein CONLIGDRAFT_629395 [Coniochaeta ligniaria NRRL 30616]